MFFRSLSAKFGLRQRSAGTCGVVVAVGAIGLGSLVLAHAVAQEATEPAKTTQSRQPDTPGFVTSRTCAQCHQGAYDAWKGSHHGWALRKPETQNVLGDFGNVIFEHRGVRSRFHRRDGSYFVETEGADGKLADFEIKYTVGVAPLQQYLVETDRGRLQALDLAWDTVGRRWFHLYPDHQLKAGDGLHWTGPYKNWQARCAVCHQTDFRKGYSPKARTYQSTWSELTVGCESCHGPGEAHVAWAGKRAASASQQGQVVDAKGLSVTFSPKDAASEIQVCAPCHSRRSPLDADSPPPGSKFEDHHRLARLTQGLYHADGQVDDEVYVFGSFQQSKMAARGVRCSNCHEPHSGELRAEGNAVCTQCHNPAGNGGFPTLRRADYDAPSHHHHTSGSAGAQCVNCHMPAKTYMQVDPRRDHSFRVPRPDLTQKIGSPNACSGCHDDKTTKWAMDALKGWFPDGRMGTPHYGEILHAGRTEPSPDIATKLIALALDTAQPAIARATALELLRPIMTREYLEQLAPLIKAESALVRGAVLPLYQAASPEQKLKTGLLMTGDAARTVRIEAAKLLFGFSMRDLTREDRTSANGALADYQASLIARADYPETQMQIAGLSMSLRNFGAAQAALKEALSMDPQLGAAWVTLARIEWALRRPVQAITTLERAAQQVPDSAEIHLQLGSIYLEQRQSAKAIPALEKSLRLGEVSPELLDMLAVSHLTAGDLEIARSYANRLNKEFPLHKGTPLVRQLLRMKQ